VGVRRVGLAVWDGDVPAYRCRVDIRRRPDHARAAADVTNQFGMTVPRTTIVVVPRETHSVWVRMLARLRENTDPSVPVVVVDGGSPSRVRRHLERIAEREGFSLIRSESVLSSNEARNEGARFVHTELVAFLDDTMVMPGWLPPLEQCLAETGGALVSPVVLAQRSGNWVIHDAGGIARIVGEGAARRLEELNEHAGQPETAVRQLTRTRTEFQELHCLLVRAEALREIGGFDEGFLAGREYSDINLRMAAAGHAAWVEPRVVVRFAEPRLLRPSDVALYLARWSDEWARASYTHFNRKWELGDTTADDHYLAGRLNQRLRSPPRPSGGVHLTAWRFRRRLHRAADRIVTPLVLRSHERRRAAAPPPRLTVPARRSAHPAA